jgi:hypothetical protein
VEIGVVILLKIHHVHRTPLALVRCRQRALHPVQGIAV